MIKETVTTCRDRLLESFKEHQLEILVNTDRVVIVRMAKPRTRVYLVQLSFTPEGICIQGDITPGENNKGVCCRDRKSLEWFAQDFRSSEYLAGKFLEPEWCPDQSRDHWESVLAELAIDALPEHDGSRDEFSAAQHRALAAAIDDDQFGSPESLSGCFDLHGFGYGFEDFRGYIPVHREGYLWAIQRKFAELWSDSLRARADKENL